MKIESLRRGDGIWRACAEQEQSLPEQRGRTARRLANVDLLLEAISQLDQAPLAPGLSQNIHSDRHAQRAVAVGGEKPAGTVMAGNPVTEARIPLRSA